MREQSRCFDGSPIDSLSSHPEEEQDGNHLLREQDGACSDTLRAPRLSPLLFALALIEDPDSFRPPFDSNKLNTKNRTKTWRVSISSTCSISSNPPFPLPPSLTLKLALETTKWLAELLRRRGARPERPPPPRRPRKSVSFFFWFFRFLRDDRPCLLDLLLLLLLPSPLRASNTQEQQQQQ